MSKGESHPRGTANSPSGTRPTLRTIADLTGLAVTTISRALNNAPELSRETRDRVQKIAAEIGYVPDRTALRLKTGRTHVISLVLDADDEALGFGRSMVNGLTAALRGTPYHLVITPSFADSAPIDAIHYILRNKMADGVIFSRTQIDDARVKLLVDNNFPFVSHGRTESKVPHAFVDFDNFTFAYHAVRRLKAKGRTRATIILPPEPLSFGVHLREGFMRAVNETGMEFEIADALLDDSTEEISAAILRRIAAGDAPDAYVCPGDAAALAVMAAITDAGLTLGQDADIVAKQNSKLFNVVRPRVDAIYEDTALAGQQLGQLLLRRINGERPEDLQILHIPEINF